MERFLNKHQERAYYNSPVYLQSIILFLLSVVLYINTIGFDYTLADTMVITENQFTTEGVSGMRDILTTDARAGYPDNSEQLFSGGAYAPLSMLMFALEYQLWGEDPFPGHLINMVLFSLLVVLAFFLLRLLFKYQYQKPWYLTLPFLAAAIFAVHPLHVDPVASIKGRDEIMAMMGALGTMWLLIRYVDLRKPLYLVFAGAVFFLALMSKEHAVIMLAGAPLIIWCFRKEKLLTFIAIMIPLLSGLVIYMLLRYNALGFWTYASDSVARMNAPFLEATIEQKYATIFYTWGMYLKWLFYPYPLTHDFYSSHMGLMSFSNPVVWLSLGVWIGLIVYSLVRIWKRDVVAFGILFFLITFAVSSGLLISGGGFMNQPFVFMPLPGFAVIAGWVFNQTLRRAFRSRYVYKRVTLFLVVVVVLAFSAGTLARIFVW